MKLKPQIYAQLLIDSLDGHADTKKVAAGFWRLLQKNNQYKDLAKILNELEIEYAKKEGKVLAKIYSEKALTDAEINEIKYKLSLRAVPLLSKERSGPALSKVKRSRMGEVKSFSRRGNLSDQSDNIIISNIIKNNWAGIEVVIDDKVIDLSTKGKIEKLRQALSS